MAVAQQRTEAGAILRSGLNQVALAIPPGARGIAVLVIDSTGAEVGAAWKTDRGWTIEQALRVAVREGRARDVSFLTRVTW